MRKPSSLALIFIATALLVGIAGYWYHSLQSGRAEREVAATLRAVAELKSAEIVRWRQTMMNTARVAAEELAAEPVLLAGYSGDRAAKAALAVRLKSYADNLGYDDVMLFSTGGKFLYSLLGNPEELEPSGRAAFDSAASTGKVALSDLFQHSGDNREAHLQVIAPIKPDGGSTVAFLVFQTNAARFLYPMIQAWPVPSETGETLLVRREGDRVLFLNELRHRSGTALSLAIPLDNLELPATQAVMGVHGFFKGNDYRGVPVASYITSVPSTQWSIVSKVDFDEAFAGMRQVNLVIAALGCVLLASVFLATRMLLASVERDNLSEQLKVERSRREAEERYRVTIMSMGDGVVVTDEAGRVLLLNPLAEALTGWRTDEARLRPLTEVFNIINMESRKPVMNPVAEVISRNVVVGLANHTVLISKDGVERPIADSAAPIRDETGAVTGVVLIFRDQTEEYRAAREISSSERRFRDLFNGMMEGFAVHEIITDARGNPTDYKFIEVNPAFEKLTGLKNKDIAGRTIKELMPDIEQSWIENYGRVALEGRELSFIDYNKHLDKHFAVHAYSPARGQFACLFHDVSAEVNARRALESRLLAITSPAGDENLQFDDLFDREKLQEIQDAFSESMGVASVIADMEGRPLTRPSNFTRFCAEIVRGTTIGCRNCHNSNVEFGRHGGTGPVMRPCLSAGLWDAGAPIMVGKRQVANWIIGQVREEAIDREKALAYADEIGADREVYMEALLEVPVVDTERFGQISRALHHMALQLSTLALQNVQQARLISERELAEREKANLTERLHQAQKLESVGRLAGGVAHDFNNMLSVILGNAELAALSLPEASPGREYLAEIRAAAERSAEITRQLLTFARKQPVAPRVINPGDTVERALKMLSRLIGEEVRMIWRPGRDLWRVRIDPVQLEQVLANLTTNARDAISGVGTITIEAANVSVTDEEALLDSECLPGEYVRFTVSDTGRGMSRQVLERIFEPFFTTKGVGEGTGLGLATVYGIARQYNGFITVQSTEGVGTSFNVFLPRFDEPAHKEEEPESGSTAAHGTELVLLVEDEPGILNLARRILIAHGYRVLAANSPEDALAHSAENPAGIDLLVTDVIMPQMNGRDLAEKVRALQPGIPVLFMSGYTSEFIAHQGQLNPGVSFLPKPFSVRSFAKKVRESLDRAAPEA